MLVSEVIQPKMGLFGVGRDGTTCFGRKTSRRNSIQVL